MANLKELRKRIDSVRSTKKITSAMKMISAVRLRKSQLLLHNSEFYEKTLSVMINRIINKFEIAAKEEGRDYVAPKILQENTDAKKYLLVVMASDRGLAGGYNINIVKTAIARLKELYGKEVKLLCIGKKTRDALKKEYADFILHSVEGVAAKGVDYMETQELNDKLYSLIESGGFDVAEVVYSDFISAGTREIISERVYPLSLPKTTSYNNETIDEDVDGVYWEYENNTIDNLNNLLNIYHKNQLFQILINSQASEHSARMTSMDAATRNAEDVMKELTLTYNGLRQTAITTELTEIISGSEAV